MSESLVRYLAIARTKGDGMSDEKHEVLASLLVNANDKQLANFASNVTKIMNKASRLMAKSSLVKLDPNEEDWSVHVHFHSIGLFTFALIAFTARNFGSHFIPANFLTEGMDLFSKKVGQQYSASKSSLERRVRDEVLRDLAARYNSSSLSRAQEKTQLLTTQLHTNIDLATRNLESLDELDTRSTNLLESSRSFQAQSKALKCQFCRDYWRTNLIILLVVGIIITIIVVAVTQSK